MAHQIEMVYKVEKGGRFGWRLPTIVELTPLLDLSQSDRFPSGHPLRKVPKDIYWSSTAYYNIPDNVYLFIHNIS